MGVRHRRGTDEQKGQMLVGVIVLLALLFFVGTAMALAVSSSLHTLALAQTMDFTDYAAESAVAVDAAMAQAAGVPADVAIPPTTGVGMPCYLTSTPPTPSGMLTSTGRTINGQATAATACYVSTVAAPTVNSPQIWSVSPATLKHNRCLPALPSFPTPALNGRVWGVIGWHSTAGTTADLEVSVHPTTACSTDPDSTCVREIFSDQLPSTPGAREGLLYFQCEVPGSKPAPGGSAYKKASSSLNIVNLGGTAYLTDFNVREADGGPDCIATMIGQAGHVVDEADWRLPGCQWAGATQVLWNGVLP